MTIVGDAKTGRVLSVARDKGAAALDAVKAALAEATAAA